MTPPSTKFLRIGIGGQIGAGKTMIAKKLLKLFNQNGYSAELIDADQIAWQLYEPQSKIYQKLIRHFGKDIITTSGQIDRKKLAHIVFNDKKQLDLLNRIIQPALINSLRKRLTDKKTPIKILDAALLFYWGKKIPVDVRILVSAPRQAKITRMKKRGYPPSVTKSRLQNQLSEKEMAKTADFIIHNNQTPQALNHKIKLMYQILKDLMAYGSKISII